MKVKDVIIQRQTVIDIAFEEKKATEATTSAKLEVTDAETSLKDGEIQETKNLNLSRNIVSLLAFGQCFPFFTSRDQLGAQQKHLLQVE